MNTTAPASLCEGIENDETAEDGHGRVESRSYYLSTDLGALSCVKKWNGLRAVGMVESERWNDGRVSIEQRYYITSLEDVETFGRAVRSHWGIENELHWRLDVTFREDESRIRRGNAPHNMGVIRHVAVNLLKREPTKISVRKKRIRAALNDGFRDKVLMGHMRLPCDFICGCPAYPAATGPAIVAARHGRAPRDPAAGTGTPAPRCEAGPSARQPPSPCNGRRPLSTARGSGWSPGDVSGYRLSRSEPPAESRSCRRSAWTRPRTAWPSGCRPRPPAPPATRRRFLRTPNRLRCDGSASARTV